MVLSEIEIEYQKRIREMTPAEKMSRTSAMLAWTRQQIAKQIQKSHGAIPSEELKWRVGLRLYQNEPEIVRMIEEKLADVSS